MSSANSIHGPRKEVLGGKRFDTETADFICDVSSEGPSPTDFKFWHGGLYKTAKGAYFINGSGGPLTMFRTPADGGGFGGGNGIRVLDMEQARNYAERTLSADEVAQFFTVIDG
jgi:hypothetical protein